MASIASKFRKRAAKASRGEEKQKPYIFSTQGIMVLIVAFIIDAVNILLGFLDFVLIGLIISPVWNAVALATVGVWLWKQTGQGLGKTKRKRS